MNKLVGVACVIAAFAVFTGCGKGDDDDSSGGSGGMLGGSGGMLGGSGGATAGAGGGAAGAPATGECAKADTTMAPAALHAAAAAFIAAEKPCAFSGCHGGSVPVAMLQLSGATDLRTLLGKMSCEAPNVPIVDTTGGEKALNNSWLWIKLTAPADDTVGIMMPQATWGGPGVCGQQSGQTYGVRMPWGSGSTPNSETRLAPIRNWICAGAPGPQ